MFTKFRLSRPTAHTSVHTTPTEHAALCWVHYSS